MRYAQNSEKNRERFASTKAFSNFPLSSIRNRQNTQEGLNNLSLMQKTRLSSNILFSKQLKRAECRDLIRQTSDRN